MTTLEWVENEDGYTSGVYQIVRSDPTQWSIRNATPLASRFGHHRSIDRPMFSSLRSARAAALHLEVVRVRRVKLIRHVTLSILTFGLSAAFYATMAAGTQVNRLEWFALAGASLIVALSEGLDAFVLLVADGWDHRYEVPRVTMFDRLVSHIVIAVLWPKPLNVATSEQAACVRPLT